MRRADIARFSAVTGGADYIFTLLDQRGRGRRIAAPGFDLFFPGLRRRLGPKASVVTGSLAEVCVLSNPLGAPRISIRNALVCSILWTVVRYALTIVRTALPTDFPRYYPSCGAVLPAPRRWAPPLLADARPSFLTTHPRFEVPNSSVDVDSWEE